VANIFSYFVDDSGYPPDQNRLPVILGGPNSHADDCWQVLGHDSQIYPDKLDSARSLLLSILEVLFRSKLGTLASHPYRMQPLLRRFVSHATRSD
jgi:hypothetical protein